jgi:hypothetical protein
MRTKRILAGGAAAGLLAAAGYGLATWYHYGRAPRTGAADELLDRFLPEYDVRERHEIPVAAPASVSFEAAKALELRRSPLIRGIFRARELLMGATSKAAPRPPRPFLEEVLTLGWRVLAEVPGREIVLGAVTRPWEADVVFRGIPPEEFAAFREAGYVKIAWTLTVEPMSDSESLFRTETRVVATDPDARARFRRYWVLVSVGIRLIRLETLRLVRQTAEANSQTAGPVSDAAVQPTAVL